MQKPKLLIADDEVDLLAELKPLLERAGFDVSTAINGEQALQFIHDYSPDLIILDVLMPHINGREVLRQLREVNNWTPIILLTQVGTPIDRGLSLQEGADDYINKPFDPFELVARIQAVLRRANLGRLSLSSFHQLSAENLRIDRQTRQASLDSQSLTLTARAFGVLEYLMLHAGEIITRDILLDKVWGWSYAVESRAVDIRVAEIRKALEDDPATPYFIETVVGQGYRFLREVKGE